MVSKNTPPRLGRGLAALLGDVSMPSTLSAARLSVPSRWIGSTPIRSSLDRISIRTELESLAESIRVQGVLQPILVRSNPTAPGPISDRRG